MAYKRSDFNMVGGVTVRDVKQVLEDRDNDELIYLDGFDFYACETPSGNLEFSAHPCESPSEELFG